MAFNASGTNYGEFQRSRDRASDQVTRAEDNLGRKRKQDRIKESGKRSGMEKLLSTAARGAAAYYTGGLSEQYGGGDMIDSAMLGTDSQGNAVKNEYGGLIKAGSGIYQGMKDNKASDVAKKRASNLSDYKEQVGLAKEMGVLDKKQGRDMLLDAQELRGVQQAQTQAGEDASLWGWDNKFDDLGMTPSQIKGQEIAKGRQATASARTLRSDDRRQRGQLDNQQVIEKATNRADAFDSQQREGQKYDPKLEAETKLNIREEASLAGTDSLGKHLRDKRINAISQSPDMYKTSQEAQTQAGMESGDAAVADIVSKQKQQIQIDQMLKDRALEGKSTGTNMPPSPYKTYSEEEAKKLSNKDNSNLSTLDSIAIKDRIKVLNDQGLYDRTFNRDEDDKQMLLENKLRDQQKKAEELRIRNARSNTQHLNKTGMYAPIKIALKKRREARLKRGGILAGATV
jgi:hypothetical protein